MDFISLLPQNAGPVTKSKFKDASRKVQMLRNRGLAADADLLASDIAGALQSGDMTAIGSAIKSLDDYYYKAPKPQVSTKEEKEQTPEYSSDELAVRIQDSIALADERGIDLPNSDLSRLSSFVAKGDTKKASEQLAKVSSFIDKSLAIQTEEEKKPKVLADGTQIEIGSKSGTRYMGGQPVSKGAINSNVFNSMYQKEPKAETEAMGVPFVSQAPVALGQTYDVAPVEGVVAQPEVYTQGIQTAPTSMEEKQITMRKASEAYKAGNDEEAVILMNAAGGKGLMGVFTKTDLPDVFGERKQQELPLSIEVKGKTYNRPKEFTDQEWDEYIKTIQSQNK
jgi:hypothetical protein